MTLEELLAECARRGIELGPVGSDIRYSCPKGAMSDELREAIRRQKAELLRLLSGARATGQEVAQPSAAPTVPPEHILSAPPADHGGGASLNRADGVTLALSLQGDGSCYVCGGSRWWLSRYAVLVCGVCHPPAVPELVDRWMGEEEASRLARA
ncbi:MAG: hypothetical protein QME70_09605 [Bacillota bacterium]|nr:hypothetical protein [Bacillota bacterium]